MVIIQRLAILTLNMREVFVVMLSKLIMVRIFFARKDISIDQFKVTSGRYLLTLYQFWRISSTSLQPIGGSY